MSVSSISCVTETKALRVAKLADGLEGLGIDFLDGSCILFEQTILDCMCPCSLVGLSQSFTSGARVESDLTRDSFMTELPVEKIFYRVAAVFSCVVFVITPETSSYREWFRVAW